MGKEKLRILHIEMDKNIVKIRHCVTLTVITPSRFSSRLFDAFCNQKPISVSPDVPIVGRFYVVSQSLNDCDICGKEALVDFELVEYKDTN